MGTLTAGKGGHRCFERRGAEGGGGGLDAGVEVPVVGVVDQVEQVGQLGIGAVTVLVATDRIDHASGTGGDVLVGAFFEIELEILRQVTDAEVLPQPFLPTMPTFSPAEAARVTPSSSVW